MSLRHAVEQPKAVVDVMYLVNGSCMSDGTERFSWSQSRAEQMIMRTWCKVVEIDVVPQNEVKQLVAGEVCGQVRDDLVDRVEVAGELCNEKLVVSHMCPFWDNDLC